MYLLWPLSYRTGVFRSGVLNHFTRESERAGEDEG